MKQSMVFAARLLLLAVVVWIGSACGGNISVPAPLLAEGFNATFPGVNWTVPVTTGSGTSPVIIGTGNPPPGLEFSVSGPTGTESTSTLASFNNPNLTISVQEAVSSAPPALSGASTIAILDSTSAVVATAIWDNATGTVSYTIAGVAALATSTVASDGVIHTFKFNVNPSGIATWALDGATTQTVAPFPAGMLRVRLSAIWGTGSAWPTFLFDNLMVSSP